MLSNTNYLGMFQCEIKCDPNYALHQTTILVIRSFPNNSSCDLTEYALRNFIETEVDREYAPHQNKRMRFLLQLGR